MTGAGIDLEVFFVSATKGTTTNRNHGAIQGPQEHRHASATVVAPEVRWRQGSSLENGSPDRTAARYAVVRGGGLAGVEQEGGRGTGVGVARGLLRATGGLL